MTRIKNLKKPMIVCLFIDDFSFLKVLYFEKKSNFCRFEAVFVII
jgi:hypothetical protein